MGGSICLRWFSLSHMPHISLMHFASSCSKTLFLLTLLAQNTFRTSLQSETAKTDLIPRARCSTLLVIPGRTFSWPITNRFTTIIMNTLFLPSTMGLLTILKKVKEEEKEIRLLILGLDNAGKTTIVKKLCGQPIDEIEPTLGFQIQSLDYKDYKLNLWDIGGQSSIRAYWRNYFEKTDGLIFVVDSSDRHRLDLVKLELDKLLKQERLAGATLLVWANKQDIQGSATSEQIRDHLCLSDDTNNNRRHWSIYPCSAVTGDGLKDGIQWLVDDIASRIFLLS